MNDENNHESNRKRREEPTQDQVLALGCRVAELPGTETTDRGEGDTLYLPTTCRPQVTDHLEYHLNVEMQRTTCQKPETMNCVPQEGELHKVLGKSTLT